MFKKMLIAAAIVSAVFMAGSAVYAQAEPTEGKKDASAVLDALSEKLESKTFESQQIISGKAKEGTFVSLTLFWFSADDEKSIIAKKKDESGTGSGTWIEQESDEWTVGASGLFAKTITLNLGRNKIVLLVKSPGGDKSKRSIEIELVNEEEANEYVSGSSLNKLIKDINPTDGNK